MTVSHSVLVALAELPAALFFAGGLLFIARMLARKSNLVGELAYVGFFLVASSVVLAVWSNLLAASAGVPPGIGTNNSSPFLLTQGFIFLAWALWRGLRAGRTELTAGTIWLAPLFISALVLGTATVLMLLRWGRAWFWLLAGAATVSILLTFLQLAWRAQQRGLPLLAILFALSFIAALAQSGLLHSGAQTPPWLGPFWKGMAQCFFFSAARQLYKAESFAQNKQK